MDEIKESHESDIERVTDRFVDHHTFDAWKQAHLAQVSDHARADEREFNSLVRRVEFLENKLSGIPR